MCGGFFPSFFCNLVLVYTHPIWISKMDTSSEGWGEVSILALGAPLINQLKKIYTLKYYYVCHPGDVQRLSTNKKWPRHNSSSSKWRRIIKVRSYPWPIWRTKSLLRHQNTPASDYHPSNSDYAPPLQISINLYHDLPSYTMGRSMSFHDDHSRTVTKKKKEKNAFRLCYLSWGKSVPY